MGWIQIGGPAAKLFATSTAVYMTDADGNIWQYNGTPMSWTQIGSGHTLAYTTTLFGGVGGDPLTIKSTLYGLSADLQSVYQYADKPMQWTQINGPAQSLISGGDVLYATSPSNGEIYMYSDGWIKSANPRKSLAAINQYPYDLFGSNHDSAGVWVKTDKGWITTAGGKGPTGALVGGGYYMYAQDPRTGHLWKYNANVWVDVGGPPGGFFSACRFPSPNGKDSMELLCGVSADRSGVWQHGDNTTWTQVGGSASAIAVSNLGVAALDPVTSNVWLLGLRPA